MITGVLSIKIDSSMIEMLIINNHPIRRQWKKTEPLNQRGGNLADRSEFLIITSSDYNF